MKRRAKPSLAGGPTTDLQRRMCTRKRRYSSQADALDAALIAGVERDRTAYHCPLCGHWHLSTARRD